MRLDAAPIQAFRTSSVRPGSAIAAPTVDAATVDALAPSEPPPSLDGKGTLINTYA